MDLLLHLFETEGDNLHKNNVRVKFCGRINKLSAQIKTKVNWLENLTKDNTGLTLIMALSYGGRSEIIDAVKSILRENPRPENINEKYFQQHLYLPDIPDPDLIIRTSGELRISNFLLWQIAYSELWITPILWPDFRTKHLLAAIQNFQKRERRFGKVIPSLSSDE